MENSFNHLLLEVFLLALAFLNGTDQLTVLEPGIIGYSSSGFIWRGALKTLKIRLHLLLVGLESFFFLLLVVLKFLIYLLNFPLINRLLRFRLIHPWILSTYRSVM